MISNLIITTTNYFLSLKFLIMISCNVYMVTENKFTNLNKIYLIKC